MNIHLTQDEVKKAQPPASGYYILFDNEIEGFGLRVTAAGTKSFVYNYRVDGRKRRHTIGKFPGWTVTAARDHLNKNGGDKKGGLILEIRNGADPVAHKKALREESTMTDLAADYIEQHALVNKRPKSTYEDRRMLKNIILPELGKLSVSAVTQRDVRKLHISLRKKDAGQKRSARAKPDEHPAISAQTERSERRGDAGQGARVRDGHYQANRVLSLLSKMFTFAMGEGMRKDNPAKGVKRYHEERRDDDWFSADQLHALSDALDAYSEQDAADALRLLIVTGARPHEVIGAEWPQFDLQRGVWTKPSHHTKERKTEHVPLNEAALQILGRMAEHKTGSHLFPGRDQDTARTTLRNAWRQVCKAAGFAEKSFVKGKRGKLLPRWKPTVRVYDLRHTFASHLVSRNWSLPLVGKLLGHVRPETTNRYVHIADGAQRAVTNDFNNVITLPARAS